MNPATKPTALVTGSSRGIGREIALHLARQGFNLLVNGRHESDELQHTQRLVENTGAAVAACPFDISRIDTFDRVLADLWSRFGGIDCLVNNAGTNDRRPPENYSMEDWHFLIDANLTSVFALTRALKPLMTRGGKIINIGSMTSIFGASFSAPYGAAKGGVVQLTKALASAWARENIQVNAILPGWIETELTLRGRAATPDLHEKVIARTPAGRWGQPGDIAGAAVFLASSASDFITGAALPVDGGYSAQA